MFNTVVKFFKFLSIKNRKKLVLAIILSVLESFFVGSKILAIFYLLRDVIVDNVSAPTAWICFAIILIGVIGSFIVNYFSTILMCEVGYGSCANKRIEIAKHLRYVPMGYFNKKSLNDVIGVATSSLENLEQVATHVIMMTAKYALNTFVVLVAMFAFDPRIGGILLGLIVICGIISHFIIKQSSSIDEKMAVENNKFVTQILEYVEGIGEVKNYNLSNNFDSKLHKSNERNCALSIDAVKKFTGKIQLQKLYVKFIGLLIILVTTIFYFQNTMDLAEVITTIISTFLIFFSLESLSAFMPILKLFDTNIEQANEIISSPEYEKKPVDKNKLPNYNIAVKNIDFAYDNKQVINGISCDIKEKNLIALVGPSGSGKTTLAKLIARFWDVDKGKIELGNKNLKDFNYDSLITNFSFVFQEVYLFNDTIENNIKLARPEATHEEVVEVAKKAHCHEFIIKLENGYDTLIGKDGINLSGGEKQRISIARAIMKDSPIIILDEATSNIDPENENLLVKAIEALTKNKTVIMIAHRLKTVRNADSIFVIDNGEVIGSGTHEDLLKTCPMYKNFVIQKDLSLKWKL